MYRGAEQEGRSEVAIKVIDLEESDDDLDDIQKEISVLSRLSCPQLMGYYCSFVKGQDLCIVMELLDGGSVFDLMQGGQPLSEVHAAIILRELLLGVEYLHSANKIHRDLKAANILLTRNGSVKLGDFGATGQLTETISKRNTFVDHCTGWLPRSSWRASMASRRIFGAWESQPSSSSRVNHRTPTSIQ